ncbi:hypothetical protein AAMO2058_000003600 [Amorphochlora amoebiformis]
MSPSSCSPTSNSPTSNVPTSVSPSSTAPTTLAPTTLLPSTVTPTICPTSTSPSSCSPTSQNPTTCGPSSCSPSSQNPTSQAPTTCSPSTLSPSTLSPATGAPFQCPPGNKRGVNGCEACPIGFYCDGVDSIACPPNSNTTGPDRASIQDCLCNEGTAGDPGNSIQCDACRVSQYCPQGSTVKLDCPAGQFCSNFSTRTNCSNDGSYCPGNNTFPLRCPPGFFCEKSRNPPVKCPTVDEQRVESTCVIAYYCPGGTPNLDNATCETGFFCPNVTAKIRCNIGIPCPRGSSTAVPCSPGFTCSLTNGTPTACEPGSYCINNVRRPCQAGKFCSDPSTEQDCDIGDYCKESSSTRQRCPKGFWCPTPGQLFNCSKSQFCEEGTTTNETTAQDCPAGSFCPNPAERFDCTPGDWCPGANSFPQPCPPGSFCALPRSRTLCEPGFYCPENSTFQSPCKVGSYCPTTEEELPCPQGFFQNQPEQQNCKICPKNEYCDDSRFPRACPSNSKSPPGSFSISNCTCTDGFVGTLLQVGDNCKEQFNDFDPAFAAALGSMLFVGGVVIYFACTSKWAKRSFKSLMQESVLVAVSISGNCWNYAINISVFNNIVLREPRLSDWVYIVIGILIIAGFALIYSIVLSLKVLCRVHKQLKTGNVSKKDLVNLTLPFAREEYQELANKYYRFHNADSYFAKLTDPSEITQKHPKRKKDKRNNISRLKSNSEPNPNPEPNLNPEPKPSVWGNPLNIWRNTSSKQNTTRRGKTWDVTPAEALEYLSEWDPVFKVLLRGYTHNDGNKPLSDIRSAAGIPHRTVDSLVGSIAKLKREKRLLGLDIILLSAQAIPMLAINVGPVMSQAGVERIRSATFRMSLLVGAMVIGSKLSQVSSFFRLEEMERRLKKNLYTLCFGIYTKSLDPNFEPKNEKKYEFGSRSQSIRAAVVEEIEYNDTIFAPGSSDSKQHRKRRHPRSSRAPATSHPDRVTMGDLSVLAESKIQTRAYVSNSVSRNSGSGIRVSDTHKGIVRVVSVTPYNPDVDKNDSRNSRSHSGIRVSETHKDRVRVLSRTENPYMIERIRTNETDAKPGTPILRAISHPGPVPPLTPNEDGATLLESGRPGALPPSLRRMRKRETKYVLTPMKNFHRSDSSYGPDAN